MVLVITATFLYGWQPEAGGAPATEAQAGNAVTATAHQLRPLDVQRCKLTHSTVTLPR